MPNDRVGFEHEIVAAIVHLRLEDFEPPIASLPQVFHNVAREEMLDQSFAVRGSGAVNVAH